MAKKGKSGKKDKKTSESEKVEKIAVRDETLWQPFDIMRNLDDEFEDFKRAVERSLWQPSWWRRSTMTRRPEFSWAETRQPLIDIKDTGKEIIIEAEMPGIPKENIDIQLSERSIEICGELKHETEDEKKGYYRQERRYSSCYRQMTLPSEVIPGKADATLKDGVLQITIPKKKPSTKEKTHKVNVK